MTSDRRTCGFHALAALRFYTAVFPTDYLPYQAAAAAMAADPDYERLLELQPEIAIRMATVRQMIQLGDLEAGILPAALLALGVCQHAIAEDCDPIQADTGRREAIRMAAEGAFTLPGGE